MPMIRLVAGLAALAWSAAAGAAGFTDPAEIDAAVTRFTGAAIGESGGARLPADRRMRLEACAHPLTAEWHGRGGQTVLVRCPAPGGWRVFVPVLSDDAPDVPPVDAVPLVDRGEAVTIAVSGRGFTLTRQGQALESGAAGEWVRVRPAGTRTEAVRARVVSPGVVGLDLQ